MFCATLVIVTKTVTGAAILRLSIGSEMLPVAHLPDNETTERRERMWSGIIKLNAVTSAANRLISEVVQSLRRPLLGPSPG